MAAKNGRRNTSALEKNSSRARTARADVSLAMRDIKDSVASTAAARDEELGPVGRELVDAGVPAWTVRAHARLGHIGGFIVFVCLMLVGWPVLITLVTTLVRVLGVNVVTRIPSAVLGEVGVPVELAVSTTDRFLFTWVIPVLFFVLVLAGLTCLALRRLAIWAWVWTNRLALGLFAGYGTGVLADRRERQAQRISNDSVRSAQWAREKAEREVV
ncbi:hypothetical protein [Rhodococcus sp. NCIMB 12038]|uniref:hypothetical protein n=1 Tax=Rhodococcus sp. NCIMB 12038 TaxID=933800 RepID=UPI000B3CD90F|nr:hypothetical protein [Rhodococcus sp. NCIMB 12038]OUS97226.1 hypothetical protein CA951_02455 [Rhodococcus sp. NCIMB 12038]